MVETTGTSGEVAKKDTAETTKENTNKTATEQKSETLKKEPGSDAYFFLSSVDNGALYNEYSKLIANYTSNAKVKKEYEQALKLIELPNIELPDKTVSIAYDNQKSSFNLAWVPKTFTEVSKLLIAILSYYAVNKNSREYQELLSSFVSALKRLKQSVINFETNSEDVNIKPELEEVDNVIGAYLNVWEQFYSDYPTLKQFDEEVDNMATADATQTATQTGVQAGSVFSNLLDAVYGILGSIIDALKNYATEIAEILVAGMLGYSVVRYGRRMLNGVINMVSGIF